MKNTLSPLRDVLEELFKKKSSLFSDIYFLHCLKKDWQELAGEEIAKTGTPLCLKKGELTIGLPSSSHLHEMHFVKETLRKKINRKFPHIKLVKIHLQVKKPHTF